MTLEEMLAIIVMEISFNKLYDICKEYDISLEKVLDLMNEKGYFDR